ncbi:CapA family protein [Paenibacillus fonticola]|uniref:CapA family protein n=1 Tax=Paenibacillus fonticola TaxID=379896 RepID=UPI00035FE95A|nr:CapA family protein [Paenibacillus fonticola]
MDNQTIDIIATGDIILGKDCEYLFDHARPLLQAADITVGQLEVTHTDRAAHAAALGRTPQNLKPIADAGFDVLTLAGNHLMDYGKEGIEDTIQWLDEHHIHYVGAGMNLAESRRPAVLERKQLRVGFLNYNCVGPQETWAGQERAGNAYIHIVTHYELDHANPGGPPKVHTYAEPKTMGWMKEDIDKLKGECDFVVVALHKGLVHTPAKLVDYEYQVSYEAIDAGADLIISHHSHILKGVEWYKGKPIYHGLCNGFVYLPMEALHTGPLPDNWAERRKALFGFEPDKEYKNYPFHPEAKFTMFAKCTIDASGLIRTAVIPCYVNKTGQPELVGQTQKGQEMFEYLRKITEAAGLNTSYEWDGNEIVALPSGK